MRAGTPIFPAGRGRVAVAVALSVLLHLLLLLVLEGLEPPPAADRKKDVVSLKLVPKGSRKQKPTEKLGGQIVNLPRPAVEQVPPKDARFLSKYDTRVKHERKARKRGRRKGGGSSKAKTSPGKARAAVDGAAALRRKGGGRTGPTSPTGLMKGMNELLTPTAGLGAAFAGTSGSTGFASDDAILGVREEGDTTMLNSRSFKYWDFFERVKEKVRGEWDPVSAYRARDPDGKVYGSSDRLTVLSVVLDSKGKVLRLDVVRGSGLPFLDKEALKAMKEASPFSNPPKGLVDDKGRISFRFGFLLDMTSPAPRFFWRRP